MRHRSMNSFVCCLVVMMKTVSVFGTIFNCGLNRLVVVSCRLIAGCTFLSCYRTELVFSSFHNAWPHILEFAVRSTRKIDLE